jgi:cell division protein FtsW (lipid II flippase)
MVVAVFTIVVGITGIVATDSAVAARRLYFATPSRFYAAGAVRIAMGLVVILAASRSRRPRTLRALGAVMCLQAISATVLGIERARAVMEWEAMQGDALLRAGAVVALAAGGFIAFAVAKRPSEQRKAIP